MKLTEMTVASYAELLGSNAPAPGGGSASALAGAQGIGLITMVAGLTLGRKKYLDYTENCNSVIERGAPICEELVKQIDRDTEAFNMVSAAMKLPKETDEEKAVRKTAIRDATIIATNAPFYTLELAHRAIRLGESLLGKFNTNCASDLGVAALNLRACAYGAWLNVLINIGGLEESVANDYRVRGEALLAEIDWAYNSIYADVMQLM